MDWNETEPEETEDQAVQTSRGNGNENRYAGTADEYGISGNTGGGGNAAGRIPFFHEDVGVIPEMPVDFFQLYFTESVEEISG